MKQLIAPLFTLFAASIPAWADTYRVTDLGILGETFIGLDIVNDNDQVTPTSSWNGSAFHATSWTWMSRYSTWEANRKEFLYPDNWLEPELYDNYDFTLGNNLGGTFVSALISSDREYVTGWAIALGDAATHATFWDGTDGTDLNSLLDATSISAGWELTVAWGINKDNWIVGDALNSLTGQYHGVLLSPVVPVPEPGTIFLISIGLAGLATTRRKNGTFCLRQRAALRRQ